MKFQSIEDVDEKITTLLVDANTNLEKLDPFRKLLKDYGYAQRAIPPFEKEAKMEAEIAKLQDNYTYGLDLIKDKPLFEAFLGYVQEGADHYGTHLDNIDLEKELRQTYELPVGTEAQNKFETDFQEKYEHYAKWEKFMLTLQDRIKQ